MTKFSLYEVWARRNPLFETHFEESLFKKFTEYGGGSVESMASKGKILGAGYELYLYALFIGLYSDKRKELKRDTKGLGQPIQFWGNLDSKKFRKAYPKLREYIFTALIAKTTEIDFIALETGKVTERKTVDYLIVTMEEFANFGFYRMIEILNEDSTYFYKSTGFLNLILSLVKNVDDCDEVDTIEQL